MICVIPVVVVVVRVDSAVAGASVVDFAAADQGAAALTTEEKQSYPFLFIGPHSKSTSVRSWCDFI